MPGNIVFNERKKETKLLQYTATTIGVGVGIHFKFFFLGWFSF